MHFLLTTDSVGGVWVFTEELALGLVERGHRVTLLSFGPAPGREQGAALRRHGIACRSAPFPLEWMQEAPATMRAAQEWLRKQVHQLRPDLVHSNQFAFVGLGEAVPTVLTVHSDLFSWWRGVHGSRPPATPYFAWYEALVRHALRLAHAVATPSAVAADDLRRHFDHWAPVTVVHNGRSPCHFHPDRHKRDVALSAGRLWDPAKSIDLFNKVALPLPLRLAGSRCPPGARTVPPTVAAITYLGQLGARQLAAEMAEARLYIATSCYEPFGLAPLEAALSGCALLLPDLGSFREVWGTAAAYFTSRSASSLEAEWRRLTFDLSDCARLAVAGRDHARQHYSAERMVSDYLMLYQRVLGAASLRPPAGAGYGATQPPLPEPGGGV